MSPAANETPDAAAESSAVTAAFALGWQMARLFTGTLSSNREPKVSEDLPGLSALPPASLVTLGLAQLDVGLAELQSFVGERATLPTSAETRTQITAEAATADSIRQAILDLHVELLIGLTAADYRLGKAYGLGRALADTCGPADGSDDPRRRRLAHHLEPHRALVLIGWLDDLTSVLPPHAGRAVSDSLQAWSDWGQTADLPHMAPATVNETIRALHRQGQRWRAIVSGEKDAHQLLRTDDYVTASRGLLTRVAAIGRSLVWQLKGPLALALGLITVGLVLMFLNRSSAQVLAGLGTVAGGLGITWRSAAGALGRVSLDVGRPLWAAELDLSIAKRVTALPQRGHIADTESPPASDGDHLTPTADPGTVAAALPDADGESSAEWSAA